jgi:membrane-associated phospholipid phosphatase
MRRPLPYAILLALPLLLVVTPPGVALDHWLVERAVALDRGSSALHASMKLGSALGRNTTVLAGLLVPAAFGGAAAGVTVRVAAVALGATWVATTVLKTITNRARPNGSRGGPNSSFPSGHASITAALAQVLSRRHRRLGPLVWVLAAWIAASRVFLGVHFPSDVLAGVLLGALIGTWALRFDVILGSAAAEAVARTSQPLRR